jgi:pimeloyl-ACP methyl ester carboxylesterase
MFGMQLLHRVLFVTASIYVGVCVIMFVMQRSLQYFPDARAMSPAAEGLTRATSETLTTPDGERIIVWWSPPADATRPVFLYLHGNGANLVARARRFERLSANGTGLMAVSWRGYGGSTGSPTESGLVTDAHTAYAELARRVDPRRIVIFGESLGSTVAVKLAAQVPVAALVLDSSFTSALDVAMGAYPFLPVSLLMRDQFRADLAAPQVTVPVLQIHCRPDPVTPFALAERLNELLAGRRPIVALDGACHPAPVSRFEEPLHAFLADVLR